MKAYLINYKVEESLPGKAVVVANNAYEAVGRFFSEWQKEAESDDGILPIVELENLSIEPLCDASDVYTV